MTQRHNRDGSTVTYYALAEAVWNPIAKRREARVIHRFGRADQVDHAALQRLVRSINRILGEGETEAPSKMSPAPGGSISRSTPCANSAFRLSRVTSGTNSGSARLSVPVSPKPA